MFGQKRDVRNTIINTINDLSNLVAKDKFYSNVDELSQALIKEGKPAVVYPTRLQALRNIPNQNIIADKNGLQIKSPLGEEAKCAIRKLSYVTKLSPVRAVNCMETG